MPPGLLDQLDLMPVGGQGAKDRGVMAYVLGILDGEENTQVADFVDPLGSNLILSTSYKHAPPPPPGISQDQSARRSDLRGG